MLAYNSADPQYWPPRYRVLDTDMTLSELYTDAEAIGSSLPQECHNLTAINVQLDRLQAAQHNNSLPVHNNFTSTSATSSKQAATKNANATKGQMLASKLSGEQRHTLQHCAVSARKAGPGLSKLVSDFIMHLVDRNGWFSYSLATSWVCNCFPMLQILLVFTAYAIYHSLSSIVWT